jgi:hypothetical protein
MALRCVLGEQGLTYRGCASLNWSPNLCVEGTFHKHFKSSTPSRPQQGGAHQGKTFLLVLILGIILLMLPMYM